QGRFVEGREDLERPLVRVLGVAPRFLLFVEPSEVEPDLHIAGIELERRPVGAEGAALVADLERNVALEPVEVGAARGAPLRLLERGERARRVARRRAPLGR